MDCKPVRNERRVKGRKERGRKEGYKVGEEEDRQVCSNEDPCEGRDEDRIGDRSARFDCRLFVRDCLQVV